MKKISALLLSALLLFSLAGAGRPVVGGDPEPTPEPIWTDSGMFSLGTISGDTYENPYIGYGCKLEGWTFADSSTIAAMNNWASAVIDADVQEMYRQTGSFTEMYATSPDLTKSINIQYQNIEMMYGNMLDGIDLDTFVSFVTPSLPEVLEKSGYSNVTAEAAPIPLGNEQHPGVVIKGTVSGLPCFQKQACLRTEDYIIFLCVSSFQTDTTDEILSLFYPLGAEMVFVSPADQLDMVFRYTDTNWEVEEEDGMVTFTNTASQSGENYVGATSEDMTMLDESLRTTAVLDLTIDAMVEEALMSASDADFSEITDCVIGGQYAGRMTSGKLQLEGLETAAYAEFYAWFAGSRAYLMISLSGEQDTPNTIAFTKVLLDSFQTATDYNAQALEPAA